MSCLVWFHVQSQSQTHPRLYRKSGSAPGGLRKRLRHFRPKKHNGTSETMIERGRAVALEAGDMVLVHATSFKGCTTKYKINGKIGSM